MPTIVFLDAATVSDLPEFSEFFKLGDFTAYETTPPELRVERARGAEVVITNKVQMDAETIAALPGLRLICVAATGTNNVDKEAAAARGIPVRNVAGYSTESVAQLALTGLFALDMDLFHLNQSVYDGTYSTQPDFTYWRRPFREFGGATLGIIGLGTIGRRVAQLATAFNMKVLYHSTSGRNLDQPYPHLELEELLRRSDVVSIHCALNDRTRDLLTLPRLRLLSAHAYLLNLGRGGIVNEADLVTALNEGALAGAMVDVYTTEPLPADHPYLTVREPSRLLLTPHTGWASVQARGTLVRGILENIRRGW